LLSFDEAIVDLGRSLRIAVEMQASCRLVVSIS